MRPVIRHWMAVTEWFMERTQTPAPRMEHATQENFAES